MHFLILLVSLAVVTAQPATKNLVLDFACKLLDFFFFFSQKKIFFFFFV